MDINTINEWLMRLKCVGKGKNFHMNIFQICILSQFLTCFTHFMKTLKWSLKMWSRSQCMTVTGWFWSSHPLPFLLLLRHVIWRLVSRLVLRIQEKNCEISTNSCTYVKGMVSVGAILTYMTFKMPRNTMSMVSSLKKNFL